MIRTHLSGSHSHKVGMRSQRNDMLAVVVMHACVVRNQSGASICIR